MDDILVSNGTLFGVVIPSFKMQRIAETEHETWIVRIKNMTLRWDMNPWTKMTVEAWGDLVEITPTFLSLQGHHYPYTWSGNTITFKDDRPTRTLTPLRSLSWSDQGVVIDLGDTPMYINRRGIQHGPARAWYDQGRVFIELTSIQYKTFQCLNVTAEVNNIEYATLKSISAQTVHHDTIRGTGTYHFRSQELSLNVNIKF